MDPESIFFLDSIGLKSAADADFWKWIIKKKSWFRKREICPESELVEKKLASLNPTDASRLKKILVQLASEFSHNNQTVAANNISSLLKSCPDFSRRNFIKTGVILAGAAAGSIALKGILDADKIFSQNTLPPPINNPDFTINERFDSEIKDYLDLKLKKLLEQFYEPTFFRPEELRNQVARTRWESEPKLTRDSKVSFTSADGQVMLLPFDDKNYFFITAYHVFSNRKGKPEFYLGDKLLLPAVIAYSKKCDLIFGFCFGEASTPIQRVGFAKAPSLGRGVDIVTSEPSKDFSRAILSGEIIDSNGSHLQVKAPIRKGHSGSPVLFNGSVIGMIWGGVDSEKEPAVFESGIAIKANHIYDMMKFFVDSTSK